MKLWAFQNRLKKWLQKHALCMCCFSSIFTYILQPILKYPQLRDIRTVRYPAGNQWKPTISTSIFFFEKFLRAPSNKLTSIYVDINSCLKSHKIVQFHLELQNSSQSFIRRRDTFLVSACITSLQLGIYKISRSQVVIAALVFKYLHI